MLDVAAKISRCYTAYMTLSYELSYGGVEMVGRYSGLLLVGGVLTDSGIGRFGLSAAALFHPIGIFCRRRNFADLVISVCAIGGLADSQRQNEPQSGCAS